MAGDINDWMRGNGTAALEGDTNASLIDDNTTNYLQNPLDRLLDNYRNGCYVRYGSAKTVIVGIGELMLENFSEDQHRMRANTAEITLTMPDIAASGDDLDTGNAAVAQYYVWAVADADDTNFTGILSLSNSTYPTGVTYAKLIGFFYYSAGDGTGAVTAVGNTGVNNVKNRVSAIGITDITRNSTAYADMDDMSIYFVASGIKPVSIRFHACIEGGTDPYPAVNICVDSVQKIATYGYNNASGTNDAGAWPMSLEWVEVLPAGSRVITVQWKCVYANQIEQNGSTYKRILVVEE